MPQRRDFLIRALAMGLAAQALPTASTRALAALRPSEGGAASVRSLWRRDETILRLPSLGDGYKMTWGADDRQLVVVNDGPGWLDPPTKFFKRSLWSIGGGPTDAIVTQRDGYPHVDEAGEPEDAPHYHGHGLLAVGGRIYQFLSALDQAAERPRRWTAAKLIQSDDGGRSWRNQDGTSPVRWEGWKEQSRERLAFFNEPNGCFSLLSILQMGQDYRANRDGYIYVYGPNGNIDGLMNELMMFRVPIDRIPNRDAYEFFGGWAGHGVARWVANIAGRKPVHVFPRGWVNRSNLFPGDIVVETWLPSVVYNEPLDLYMMVSAGTGCAPDGTEFAKPGYLGFWVSATPWGPWRQVHEEAAWTPGGDPVARAYSPQIAPKWIAPDGKSFWLVWADLKGIREFSGNTDRTGNAGPVTPEETAIAESDLMRRAMPGYSFNAQRVDLDIG
ncbi:DUF4185 domain-containing protein [Nitrospirillum pindoramense]|uniref:Uncharacterized protein DUF4185 n=1 Tax=Nitrospirillum amazonense TaxID=28077 RepID=A0A560HET9_9PROT|nr:DUF4185 domain-containing protein [Nitrospirillum amazonense]TWB44004.1 uncharacterized protein DUF4185 [Nitrospirillum amazonense]